MTARAGGCLCGELRYRVEGEPRNCCYCHCRSCRLACGAVGVAWATFDVARFSFERGQPGEVRSSEKVVRQFCPRCGTSLTYTHADRPNDIDVTVATLDDAEGAEPVRHIWVVDKPTWVILNDGLPQHETVPGAS